MPTADTNERPVKIKPCKKCGSTRIKLWDCGYSSFNPGGGTCEDCGAKAKGEAGPDPKPDDLARIWNEGQALTTEETLQAEIKKLRAKLRRTKTVGGLVGELSTLTVELRPDNQPTVPGNYLCARTAKEGVGLVAVYEKAGKLKMGEEGRGNVFLSVVDPKTLWSDRLDINFPLPPRKKRPSRKLVRVDS